MTDRGGQATLQTIAGRPGPRATSIGYVKPDVLQQYKQINKELPGVHSARTGLAGLSRNWQSLLTDAVFSVFLLALALRASFV